MDEIISDRELIKLFLSRDDRALELAMKKYKNRLMRFASRFLEDERDSEECVNDAFWKAWKSIPPQQPDDLFPYLARLCRFTAYDLIEKRNTAKRSALMVELTREMEECIPDIYAETDMKGEELTVLGVHAYNAFIHRGSVEMYLENADKVEASGNVENQIMENEHIRITLDTVLSDGYTALAIVTLDALDDYGKNFVINHPFIMLRRLDTGEAVLPIGSGGMDDWTEQIKNDSIKYYHEIILSKIDTVCDYEMIFYSDGIFKDEEYQGRSSALDENYIPVDNPLGYDFIAKVNFKKNVDTVTLTGENGKKLILSQFEIISNDESLDMIDVEHESFKLIKNDGTFEVRDSVCIMV